MFDGFDPIGFITIFHPPIWGIFLVIFFPTTEQAKSKMMGCGTGVATPSTPMDSPERYFDRIH